MKVVDAKEKLSLFRGIVSLFDTKLSASIIVVLIIWVWSLTNKNSVLENKLRQDNEKWREREVAMYERILNSPKLVKMEKAAEAQQESSSRLDTVLNSVKSTLKTVNNSLK